MSCLYLPRAQALPEEESPDSKSGVRVTVPWVRIPPLPNLLNPRHLRSKGKGIDDYLVNENKATGACYGESIGNLLKGSRPFLDTFSKSKIVFDSEDCQNAANKNGPRQVRNPNVNRLSSCVLQE
jgi:hypothetical protein